jgi:NAD+ kinase
MIKFTMPRILLFSRKTVYETALGKGGNVKLRRLIRAGHPSVKGLKRADAEHRETLEDLLGLLARLNFSVKLVYDFRRVDPREFDVVMTVGGDGTVLYASRHVDGVPLLGVNSSPSSSAGYLTSATRKNLKETLGLLAGGRIGKSTLHRLAVHVDGSRVDNRVLNDVLFTSICPAVTARYVLKVGGVEEQQMSSGIWIGPAAGSTAALKAAGGRVLPPTSRKIQFVVREPMERRGMTCRLKKGIVGPDAAVAIMNRWQQSEVFIDGPLRRLVIRPGSTVTVSSSNSPLVLLGWR